MLMVMNFNVSWANILHTSNLSHPDLDATAIYIVPAFSGHHNFGHWFLTILSVSEHGTVLYIHDTLASSPEKTSFAQAFYAKIGFTIDQLEHIRCVPQDELECGPRTIVAIHDIVDQLNDGHRIERIAQTIATYEIPRHIFATHSRRWLYDLIYTTTPNVPIYVLPSVPRTQHPRSTPPRELPQPNDLNHVHHEQARSNCTALPHSPIPTTINDHPNTNTLPPTRKLDVSHILTHSCNDDGDINRYFYTKRTVTDDIIFTVRPSEIGTLSKTDRRHFNQYDATLPRTLLYANDTFLTAVLDRQTKMIDTQNQSEHLSITSDFFLTRRTNGTETIVTWEHDDLAKTDFERKLKSSYKPTTSKRPQDAMSYTSDDDGWGNTLETKQEGTIRITMENINNIPSRRDHNLKLDNGKKWLVENDVDIACWIETGVPWHKRHKHERLPELMREDAWDHQITITSNNVHDDCGTRQFGGTATMLFDHVASTMNGSGYDSSGLGRWSWVQLQGKFGISTTIVTAYCPCKSNLTSPETVYNQHRRYLMTKNRDICPREAFRHDLSAFLTQRAQKGDQIVLCIDLNEDVNRENGPIQQTLLHTNKLTNILKHRHDFPTPATHDRGTKTIDSIFVSSTLIECDATGWLPFGHGIGDHRPAFVDIQLSKLICKEKYDIAKKIARRLQIKNEHSVKRYIEICEREFAKHKIIDRLVTLRQRMYTQDPDITRAELATLDRIRIEIVLRAERKCRKLKTGQVPYAPEDVQRHGKEIRLWSMIIAKKSGKKVSTRLIARHAHAISISNYMNHTLDAIKRMRANAWKQYRESKPTASEKRTAFLMRKATEKEEEGDDNLAKKIREINKNEHMRRSQREVQGVLKPRGQSNILHIELRDEDNTSKVRKIIDRDDMESIMMNNFKSKFLEVYDTPIPHAPFNCILGQIGLGPAVEKILDGTYVFPPVIHPDIIEFFEHCRMTKETKNMDAVKTNTRPDTFTSFWRPRRERISSSSSGIHNGHYIAASLSIMLSTIIATLSSIPWELGMTYERWKTSLNVALEKVAGVRLLEKLRTIHLLEADFNTATKLIFAQRTMDRASETNQIPQSQYAKKRSRPIEAVLLKRLFYDYLRIMKTAGIVISNDARGCFDRMALAIGAIAFRRLGVPWNAIKSLFTTLKGMKHFVRTAHGDSETHYEGSKSKPLQGGGQGNGAAGPMWIAISIILLNIIATVPINATLIASISLATLVMSAIMYVDDTDILITAKKGETLQQLKENAQTLIRKWCSVLWISGGCLRPDKCWWYVVDFTWRNNGTWRYKTKKETEGTILIPDHQQIDQVVQQKEPHQGMKGLGVFLAPDGNNKAQYDDLEKKIKIWASRISKGYLTRFAADVALRTTIFRTVEYPLAATTFSLKQCDQLLRPILKAVLPKLGIARTTGRKYLHGPLKYQGSNIPHIYTELGYARLNLLLQHGGQPTQVGQALQCCLEGLQLECGTIENFLTLDFDRYHGLVTDSTLKHTWKFLHEFGLTLETGHTTPTLLRENDAAIMSEIIRKTSYSMEELKYINYCRLYLQVLTLSDITEGNGRQVTTHAAEGIRDYSRVSKWNWPNIPYPPAHAWAKWRGAIEATFLVQDSRQLRHPLGNWLDEPHQKWIWFMDKYDEVLYEKRENYSIAYPIFGRRLRNTSCHRASGRRTTTPTDLKRTTVEIIKDYMIYSQGSYPDEPIHRDQDDDDHDEWTDPPGINLFDRPTEWKQILQAVASGTCIAVTDGSFDPDTKLATACWIIEGRTSEGRAKGAAKTPGNTQHMDAYRAELHGIYCILYCMKTLCEMFQVEVGRLTIACDCDGALFRALKYKTRATISIPNFDLLWAIADLRKLLPIDIDYVEVKGHQDTASLGRPLTRLERLNCETDAGAKEYLTYVKRYGIESKHELFGNQWRLRRGDDYLYTRLKSNLYDVCHGKPLRAHIMKRKGYTETTFANIDWDAVQQASKTLSTTEKMWLTKHVGRYNPTGRQMLRRKYWSDSKCPRCDEPDEDSNHVVMCPQAEATTLREDLLVTMSDEMKRYGTLEAIRFSIILTLFQGQQGSFVANIPDHDESYPLEIHQLIERAAAEQDTIGVTNFFDGHVSTTWKIAQEKYYRQDASNRRNGSTWSKRLVLSLYRTVRKLWEHRNASLFTNSQCKISTKRRAMLLDEVQIETSIGQAGIREKDAKTICFHKKTVENWQSAGIETWLKHVRKTRQRNHEQGLKRRFDGTDHDDEVLNKRRRSLLISASRNFQRWRLKTHYETASQYLHSKKELSKDLQSFGWQIIE